MSTTFLTYVWHHVVARTLYDELLRPLARGDASLLLVLAGLAAVAFCVIWLVMAFAFKYSSLSALTASVITPILLWWFGHAALAALFAVLTLLLPPKSSLLTQSFLAPYVQEAAELMLMATPKELQKLFQEKQEAIKHHWRERKEQSTKSESSTTKANKL